MCVFSTVPESVYLVESLTRVNMSHNCIKELSSLIGQLMGWLVSAQGIISLYLSWLRSHLNIIVCLSPDTWHNLVTLDLSSNMITALHVSTALKQIVIYVQASFTMALIVSCVCSQTSANVQSWEGSISVVRGYIVHIVDVHLHLIMCPDFRRL